MEVIEIIQKCIGRKLNNEVCNSKIPICEDAIDSIEMVKIIVEIEKEKNISLDNLLSVLDKLTIRMLRDAINEGEC